MWWLASLPSLLQGSGIWWHFLHWRSENFGGCAVLLPSELLFWHLYPSVDSIPEPSEWPLVALPASFIEAKDDFGVYPCHSEHLCPMETDASSKVRALCPQKCAVVCLASIWISSFKSLPGAPSKGPPGHKDDMPFPFGTCHRDFQFCLD